MECVVLPFGGSWGRGERIMCLGFSWFCMEILWFRVDYLGFSGLCVSFKGFLCRLEREILGFGAPDIGFLVFLEREICVYG